MSIKNLSLILTPVVYSPLNQMGNHDPQFPGSTDSVRKFSPLLNPYHPCVVMTLSGEL